MHRVLSKWYLFLASVLVTVTSFCVVVFAKTSPKSEERITFVVGAFNMDVGALSQKLNEKKPSSIKEINVKFDALESYNFGYTLTSLIRSDTDFFILPHSYFDANKGGSVKYAATIKKDYVESQLERQFEYYVDGDYLKGIKIYDSSLDEGILKDYIIYTKEDDKSDYYLFFTYNSHNIGSLNDSGTTNAFTLLKEMFAL